ncbi:MAG: SRPBCC family protein [Candidatus Omnitrophica bacterium]|nr:SRPBCC family protein [Candidatus Omnitrophota bacterium]
MLKKQRPKEHDVSHYFFFVEVPVQVVAAEAMLWGESAWWPKNSLTHYIKEMPGDLKVGTRYKQIIHKPFAPSWTVEITKFIPNRLIERKFVNGMFKGYELLIIGERANGTRVDYELHYKIRGLFNMILWPYYLRKQYDMNAKLIMSALKERVIQKNQEQAAKNSKMNHLKNNKNNNKEKSGK